MVRSVLSVHRVRPAFSRDGVDAEGPDEDALTFVVDALEEISPSPIGGPRPPLGRVHLVGPCPESDDWAVREATGLPHLEVHHHPRGPAALFAALSLASNEREDGTTTAVLAVDLGSAPTIGGGAPVASGVVGFALGQGKGVRPTGHGHRAHPSHRRPDATEWAGEALRASGLDDRSGPGELLFISSASPPVLLATWTKLHPAFPASTVVPPTRLGDATTLGTAVPLADLLARLREGQAAILARVEPEQTYFLGLRSDGPADGRSFSLEEGRQNPPAPGPRRSSPGGEIDRVSEGAYVPYPTYRENLPSRWRFVGERCGACGKLNFPARHACRFCGERAKLTSVELPRTRAEVEAVTTVHPGAQPTEFDLQVESDGAYDVVLVRLTPEVRVTLQMTGSAAGFVKVGERVDTRFRRLYPMEGRWRYGRKAVRHDPVGPQNPSPG